MKKKTDRGICARLSQEHSSRHVRAINVPAPELRGKGDWRPKPCTVISSRGEGSQCTRSVLGDGMDAVSRTDVGRPGARPTYAANALLVGITQELLIPLDGTSSELATRQHLFGRSMARCPSVESPPKCHQTARVASGVGSWGGKPQGSARDLARRTGPPCLPASAPCFRATRKLAATRRKRRTAGEQMSTRDPKSGRTGRESGTPASSRRRKSRSRAGCVVVLQILVVRRLRLAACHQVTSEQFESSP